MLTRIQIAAFLALAVASWTGLVLLRGGELTWNMLWPFGTVVGFLAAISIAWDRILWRLPFLHGWFVQRPYLAGTWRVAIDTTWRGIDSDSEQSSVVAFAVVSQTYSRLSIRLLTAESQSWLVADRILPSVKGIGYQIFGVYINEPMTFLRGSRSEIHKGAFALDTHGSNARPEYVTGEYWTDRGTRGRMELRDRARRLLSRYEDAKRVLGASGKESGPNE